MPYDLGVYEAVAAAYAQKRREKRALFERRQLEIHQKSSQVLDIDRELSNTAFSVARAVLSKTGDAAQLIRGLQLRNQELQLRRARLLVEMGYPEDYLDYPYDCPKCKDEGYIDTKMCLCMKQSLKQEAIRRLNQVSGMSLCTFDSFSLGYYPQDPDAGTNISPRKMMEAVLDFCRQYAELFSMQSPNLFLFGSTGLGKTHLSLAIAGKVMEKGFGVVYGSAPDLLAKVERERFVRGGGSDDTLQGLMSCDLLILDDLGAEFSSQFTIAVLYQLLNGRLMSAKPTIINSNLTTKELYDRYSERIMSRIVGNYETLRFLGADIRQLKRKDRG